MYSKQKPDHKLPYAIIIGLDNLVGIQTTRILSRHNIPVIAIAKDPDHYSCRTRVCEKIIYTDTTSEELIHVLIDLGSNFAQKAVLYPCTDMNVLLISRHRHELGKWYHIALPSPEVVEVLMDKLSFYTYAQENGFQIPPTRFLNKREDAVQAAEEFIFPCILKPPMSAIPTWEKNSKLKAYKVSTPAELLEYYDRLIQWSQNLIIQEWIVGPDSNLFSCNCYLDAQSIPLVTFVARKLRQWPPVTGESSLG